jgi:rubrerythrin
MDKGQITLLAGLAENEEAIGVLYREYATRFPEYDSFWHGLADEEQEHADWIRVLCASMQDGRLLIRPGRFKGQAILTYLDYLRREVAKVRQGEITLLNALAVTLYIEESLLERKYFEVFETDAPQLSRVLQNLAASTRTHVDKARRALDSYRKTSASQ